MPEYVCPECGESHFNLLVKQTASVIFLPDDDHDAELVEGDLEWDDDTHAECLTCGYEAPLGQMKQEDDE